MADKKKSAPENTGGPMAFERPIQILEQRITELEDLSANTELDLSSEIEALRKRKQEEIDRAYSNLGAWETVNVARHADRPVTTDYITTLLDDFIELHGDKAFGDDRAIVTGLATMAGRRFMLIGHRKGRTTKSRLACNFGSAHPEGYRKALRKMHLAEKLNLPIVTMINTPGAYPGIGAEERGQALAIAENIIGMLELKVPIVCVLIGEGGSGGALGIGVGDRILQMQFATYSVISPEGCAAILWKNGERAPEAAEALKLTSGALHELGIVDEVIREPPGGAHRDPQQAIASVQDAILRNLEDLEGLTVEELLEQRSRKYRRIAEIPGRFPSVEP